MSPKELLGRFSAQINGKEKPEQLLNEFITDEGLKAHIAQYEHAFPRYALQVEDLVEEGDKIAARLRFQGTHTNDLNGIPPTFKTVDVPFMAFYRFADNKIAEFWISLDQMTLLNQLGVVPETAS
jgi:predicted ester cyclase